MSSIQYGSYAMAREKERLESKQSINGKGSFGSIPSTIKSTQFMNDFKGGALTSSSVFSKSTSYRIKSRQISNIYFPENDDDSKMKDINIYDDMKTYSPKMFLIGSRIQKNRKAIIYSNFVKSGIEPMSKYLETLGYNNYDLNNESSPGENGYYAIYSGDVKPEDRTRLLNHYNDDSNDLTVLLISASGAEGISTKGTRDVHIMEPYWNHERILQVMARAIRYHSHSYLPNEDRNVTVYLYLADYLRELSKRKFRLMFIYSHKL